MFVGDQVTVPAAKWLPLAGVAVLLGALPATGAVTVTAALVMAVGAVAGNR